MKKFTTTQFYVYISQYSHYIYPFEHTVFSKYVISSSRKHNTRNPWSAVAYPITVHNFTRSLSSTLFSLNRYFAPSRQRKTSRAYDLVSERFPRVSSFSCCGVPCRNKAFMNRKWWSAMVKGSLVAGRGRWEENGKNHLFNMRFLILFVKTDNDI